ncbi:YcaO-like family protein [Streptomyces sp. UNOB3_S3]|uniref:YcaO-like family protein n=1 Tax=Streptomyces sp. UNOB3_S3 TaxID=2871682 RepID=UPI001E42E7E6|nr:YcaO-like family protein [Streptomyces sp. UNOB3_S3]MCC3776052.1 YcaO-like family protein [Streptomyces sp. UNOB3_S3]
MRIEPEAGPAARDEDRLGGLVAGVLTSAGCATGTWQRDDLRYPGMHALAHHLRSTGREPLSAPDREHATAQVRLVVLRSRDSAARARRAAERTGWAVDLAPPGERHLEASVLRALRQAPEPASGSSGSGRTRTAAVIDWDAGQREVLEEAWRTLRTSWPRMAAELEVTLRQVVLLGGWGIDGFTDFAVHGAVFVNSRRLTGREPDDGPAGHVRLAEALVHEGTHNRCDAAAASAPFLRASGDRELLSTPLRPDPRPLAGLFQQVVVLARSVLLYRRLPDGPAVRARHALLLDRGRRGAATLRGRSGALTDAGRELLEQAEAVLVTDSMTGSMGRASRSDRAGSATGPPSGLPGWPVQTLRPFPDAPWFVLGRTAARSSAFTANDAAGGRPVVIGSAAGTDRADVVRRARGELMERVHSVLAGHRARERAVVASYASLRRQGRPALDPWAWPELRPLAEVREATLPWVPAESLTGGGQVLVPACAVYLAHRPPAGCPAPLRPGSTGLAAHLTAARAREHAMLEILERDLFWHAWYDDAPRRTPPGPAPLGEELRRVLAALGLREQCLMLPGPDGTACVVACLHAGDGTRQSFGARATASDPASAAVSAVREALMVRWSMGTASAAAVWDRMREHGPPRLPSGPLEHALHAFHRQDSLTVLLRGANAAPPWPTAVRAPAAGALPRLLAERTGEDVVEVDSSAPGAGYGEPVVVRVVAPGARRLPTKEPGPATLPGGTARQRLPHPLG